MSELVKGLADCAKCGRRFAFHTRRDVPPDLGFGHGKNVYCFDCDPIFPPFRPSTEIVRFIDGEEITFEIETNAGQDPASQAIYEWFFGL